MKSKYKRKKNKGISNFDIKILVIASIILVISIWKYSDASFVNSFKENISVFLNGTLEVKEAITTIGNNIFQNNSSESEILEVSKDETEQPIGGLEIGEMLFPNYAELYNPEMTMGYLYTPIESSVPHELYIPKFIETPEEYMDDTANEPFEIPMPDKVDSKKYKLPFTYTTPTSGGVTSKFGYRNHPIKKTVGFHSGLDISSGVSSNINAFADGKVSKVDYSSVYGNYIVIDHGNGYQTLYAHCEKIYSKLGAKVKKGQKIALTGTTGMSTGIHLHFEIMKDGKFLNPSDYITH